MGDLALGEAYSGTSFSGESMDRIFWQCSKVRPLWHKFLDWFQQAHMLDASDIHSFFVYAWNQKMSPQIVCFWKAGIITLIWSLWSQRNRCIFEDESFAPMRFLQVVKVSFLDMENNFTKLGSMHNSCDDLLVVKNIGVRPRAYPSPEFINVYWWPPVNNWIKVNTDGSALGAPGKIGAGGVFRDKFSWVRGCFHVKGGIGFAFEAELLAVITAIQIAHARHWRQLWIESDSTYIVHLRHERSTSVPWRFAAIWKRILLLLKDFQIQISHIYREGNKVADILAADERHEGWWPHEIELYSDRRLAGSLCLDGDRGSSGGAALMSCAAALVSGVAFGMVVACWADRAIGDFTEF
ncbi:uncharacterized protein LOC131023567 [Salvia miltiorrhiza]|uniref:uncharacterized protein LOC131023567 n=1 Tax=Salvia miltiorrhiza TaxID=226208 RepID=UPI0025AC5654|nr:uncharacterized protein LOC131023567 [Salvia miltiorrhiza]